MSEAQALQIAQERSMRDLYERRSQKYEEALKEIWKWTGEEFDKNPRIILQDIRKKCSDVFGD